jgi:predicted extracellular nuclease
VAVEGVVVGDVQEGLNGVFVQDPRGDGDPATSDGLFVFGVRTEVQAGDAIRAVGTVTEFGALTELTDVASVAVCRADAGLPAVAPLALPATDEERERLEGMRVTVRQALAVTDTRNLDDFGEVLLAAGGPLRTPTEVAEPGEAARAVDAENDRRSLLLDDASSRANPNPVPYVTPEDSLRRGDTTAGLTGVLSQGFGAYRLQPTERVAFAEANPRPARPADVGGEVRIGSFNVLNYFITHGGAQDRGASNAEQFAEQKAKVVEAINGLGADVVALQEIQNTARRGLDPDAALDDLVAALNADAGAPTWAKVPTPQGFAEDDEIRVAQIYKPREVRRVGEAVAFTGPALEAAFSNARQPLAQTYRDGRETFTVVANHLKSKGCGGATGENRDQGDGQGCFNADRVEQARALLGFVAERQAASRDEDVLVLGDLNAYTREDPIDVLLAGGLVNVLAQRIADERRYSYVFDGAQGVLDHALANPELARKVTGATEWHINADEPQLLEYDADEPDSGREAPDADAHLAAFFRPDPYRSSDHDALLLGLNTRGRPSP